MSPFVGRIACQGHLDENFFRTALPAAILLNDSGLIGYFIEVGCLEGDITLLEVVVRQ